MDNVSGVLIRFKDQFLTFTNVPGIKIGVIDIIEILIISVLFYHLLLWIKTTRAWNLFKGLIIILLFVLVAALFQMDTILWLAEKLFNVGLVAMDNVSGVLIRFKDQFLTFTNVPGIKIGVIDIIEILIISVLFYHLLLWIKTTRAWNLFKGLIIILLFVLVAALFQMDTILWLAEKLFNVGLVALVVIFQPELRNALENIGGKTFLGDFFNTGKGETEKFSDKTIDELVRACFAMGRVKTGALIVMEDEINLGEYIRTGIDVDAILTSQLLINIFEKNTPLHDGAVIVRGNRVVSATCYLPLSDSLSLSKDLGTRHRAAVGVSEVSDSLTIIVSEETGAVSTAYKGQIAHDIDADHLRAQLKLLQNRHREPGKFELIKRRFKNGKEASKNLHK